MLFLLPTELAYLDHLKEHNAKLEKADLGRIMLTGLKGRPGNPHCPQRLLNCRDLPGFVMGTIAGQVEDDWELKAKARKAFLASMNAYKTFPRALKEIFNYKELHTGHLAATYGLKEAPKKIYEENIAKGKGKGGKGGKGAGKGFGKGGGKG